LGKDSGQSRPSLGRANIAVERDVPGGSISLRPSFCTMVLNIET
jgi:hypothetical protein